ncbi:hypothetical protein [Nonomuraea endophytica]
MIVLLIACLPGGGRPYVLRWEKGTWRRTARTRWVEMRRYVAGNPVYGD